MIPGMNPRKMEKMMKRMGIQQTEVDANEVIIRGSEKEIIITEPQVSKVNMMGQETFQIVGNIEERELSTEPDINEDDVKTVMEQTNSTKEEAEEAIKEESGDLAAAIMKLKK